MSEYIQILLIAGSLITGILVIFLTGKLVKKYKLPYLSSYYFYLIFLFVFGIYGLIGSRLIMIFLQLHNVEARTIESTFLFFSYLGFPFLILSWYMFIRLSRERVNKSIPALFNLLFFSVIALAFAGLGLVLMQRERLGEDNFDIIRRVQLITFSLISVLVYGYSLVQLFINASRQIDIKDRMSIRMFGYAYLLFSTGTIFLIHMAGHGELYGFGLIILFFSIHLIPVFFQTLHLDKNFVVSEKGPDFDNSLDLFIEKYGISKRETEVVHLIRTGKSNQEISDSLFISLQTVKDHIYNIYLKTGVKNRVQLTNLIRTFS